MKHLVKDRDESNFYDLIRSYKYQALVLIEPDKFTYLKPIVDSIDKVTEKRKSKLVDTLLLQLGNGTDVDLYPEECDEVYNRCPAEGSNPNIQLA